MTSETSEESSETTAVLRTTMWWDLGFSVNDSRQYVVPSHHQPSCTTNHECCWGHSRLWLLPQATTSSFGHVAALIHTSVITCGHLCIRGGTGTAVLCTCNSTSSQSPQESSGQEEVCWQAGQIGHVEANRGTSETDPFTASFCFFCQSYWICLLIWSSARGFIKISKGPTLQGEKLKFGIF